MNIYFSGIGGVALGPLAEIARDAGYHVVGTDLEESLVTKKLAAEGITVHVGQDGSFLQEQFQTTGIDWFIYTAALPEDHVELALARQLGIPTAKRDELLAKIIEDKNLKLIAIAGTHGKTTTTGMTIWALQQLGIPVSYSVGTTISFGPSGKFDPASEYFVYECDEFDRNFLHFSPYLSLIASIDYDHSDTYKTEADYAQAFRQFATQSTHTITWASQKSFIFEGLDGVTILPDDYVNAAVSLPGDHNRHNATLVLKGLQSLGIDGSLSTIVSAFPGTDRRFEKLAPNLYSDYGHHPVEIAATLELASELSDHVVLIYQPHQNIRQHELLGQYTDQFEKAEKIYWLPTYLSREDPTLEILDPTLLIQTITNKESITISQFDDTLWDAITDARNNGKLVLGMGAGAIDKWLREQLVATN